MSLDLSQGSEVICVIPDDAGLLTLNSTYTIDKLYKVFGCNTPECSLSGIPHYTFKLSRFRKK